MLEKIILEVQVSLEEFNESSSFDLFAYAFSSAGRLLDKQPLLMDDTKPGVGKAKFVLDAKRENVMVKLGPNVEKSSDLAKHTPQQQKVILDPINPNLVEFKIDKFLWIPWLRLPYLVRGTVNKLVGDELLPVPFGEVDIFDIDLRFLIWLPDIIIEQIRDAIIDVIMDPPPIVMQPFPDFHEAITEPSWWHDDYCGTPPHGPRPLAEEIYKMLDNLPKEWAFSRERFNRLPQVRTQTAAKMERMTAEARSAMLDREALEGIKVSTLLYSNTVQFRKLLIDKFQSFRFWICWYPWIYWLWWPHVLYHMEKLGTASLHSDGSFSRIIWLRPNRVDIPDLWFRVRQMVNGVERVIYARHPIPCHTYWNHPSGEPVHLLVTDPQAVAFHHEHDICVDPGLWVCPVAIGNYSLKRVYGTGAEGFTGPADPNIGLYSSISSGVSGLETFEKGPFGGQLGLRILFSNGLLDAGIKYYRIKYRVNRDGNWMSTTQLVTRHYSHYNPETEVLEFLPYHLGPQSVGTFSNCFEIRPKDPPNIGEEPDAEWFVLDATVDLISAYINTSPVSGGLLEIKLELFDAGGNRVRRADCGGTDILFKLPSNTDILNTITTVDAVTVNPDLVQTDPEDANCNVFLFKLRYDNRTPTAIIDLPETNSHNHINDCGILAYKPADTTVNLSYQARHPRCFAMYDFEVFRFNETFDSQTGQAGDMGTSGNFTIPAKLHKDPLHPFDHSLLRDCHNSAAFSLNLSVYNMAFNGWSRLGPDSHDTLAFALVPEE